MKYLSTSAIFFASFYCNKYVYIWPELSTIQYILKFICFISLPDLVGLKAVVVLILQCLFFYVLCIYTYSWQIQRQVLAYSHIQKVWFGLFRLNLRNERGGGHLSNKQQSKKYRVEEKNSRYRNTVVHGKKVLMYHHMYR